MAPVYLLAAAILLVPAIGLALACRLVYPRTFTLEQALRREIQAGKIDEAAFRDWPQQAVSIRSPYGYSLSGTYFTTADATKTIILTHGFPYNHFGSVKYVPLFRKRGFNVLIYDLRRHGASGGPNATFGFYEKYDLKAIVDWCLEKNGGRGPVGSMGESLGAAIALQHAAVDSRLAFVIADCSFSTLPAELDYRIRYDYRIPPAFWISLASCFSRLLTGMAFEQISPLEDVGRIEAPVFFIHTARDGYIPAAMCEQLYAAKRRGPRKIFIAPNGGHAEAFWLNQTEYDYRIGEFFAENGIV